MTTSNSSLSRANVYFLSIFLAIGVSVSIFFEFLPILPIVGCVILLIFFIYPAFPTFLLTFIFLVSQEVMVFPSAGLALQLPTEPLILILGAAWVIHFIFNNSNYSDTLSIFDYAVIFYLCVLAVSVVLSSHKFISLKFFVNAVGYLIVCVYWTKSSITNTKSLIRLIQTFFCFAIIIACFSITKHSFAGFVKEYSNIMTEPFFEERGTYSAYLSIIFGFSFTIALSNLKNNSLTNLSIFTAIITIIAITLSYTRAAWLSCLFIISCFFVFRAGSLIKNKYFWVFITLIVVSVIALGSSILVNLQENALTIVDVQRNVSNLERINRWVAAVNMFLAKPIFGFGVGTYPIHFYEFQNPLFSTIISDMYAGAHNDYLQYLSEAGLVGLGSWIFLLSSIIIIAYKTIKTTNNDLYSTLTLGATLGITSYLFHALFNGYLEFDKVAVPFWLTIGIILSIRKLDLNSHQELATK
ncbi:MAG: O-antigen ligase family protein [bacterium]|nr:O-antigen ligase family protein [bacterium]